MSTDNNRTIIIENSPYIVLRSFRYKEPGENFMVEYIEIIKDSSKELIFSFKDDYQLSSFPNLDEVWKEKKEQFIKFCFDSDVEDIKKYE